MYGRILWVIGFEKNIIILSGTNISVMKLLRLI